MPDVIGPEHENIQETARLDEPLELVTSWFEQLEQLVNGLSSVCVQIVLSTQKPGALTVRRRSLPVSLLPTRRPRLGIAIAMNLGRCEAQPIRHCVRVKVLAEDSKRCADEISHAIEATTFADQADAGA